ncbi:MAG: spermidine/putrescine ABC transporter substrate-binding protein, partial [Actinobacteria bacterium]|nr:spermidine/putrescine ABC transporter substrate-binding protein [Actinomycetota bacterium]
MMRKITTAIIASAFAVALLGACGGSSDSTDTGDSAAATLGEGEGEVNLVAWAGYVEDGSTDPAVDWVSDFEAE